MCAGCRSPGLTARRRWGVELSLIKNGVGYAKILASLAWRSRFGTSTAASRLGDGGQGRPVERGSFVGWGPTPASRLLTAPTEDLFLNVLFTGSSGLIGSEAVRYFDRRGHAFSASTTTCGPTSSGPAATPPGSSTPPARHAGDFEHHAATSATAQAMSRSFEEIRPDLIIHCAAQPSHDMAARCPFDDFDVNAVGTLNLLEATRQHAPEAVFVLMSTNKVYGDVPERTAAGRDGDALRLRRPGTATASPRPAAIDQLPAQPVRREQGWPADVMRQEYGRYFGMKTGVFRGGCLTGPCALRRRAARLPRVPGQGRRQRRDRTRSIGYKGKQVRDQIHSNDVIRAFEAFCRTTRGPGEVYNLGGGRENAASVLECSPGSRSSTGRPLNGRMSTNRGSATTSATSATWPSFASTSRAGN